MLAPGLTRSGLCAEAVCRWLAERQEAEIEQYYQTMSDEEHAEDEEWAKCEQLTCLDKQFLVRGPLGQALPAPLMREVVRAIRRSIGELGP